MPEITPVFAAVFALLFIAMSADAARQRARHRVPMQGLGDDNKHVNRAVRIHGNFAEYVPFALVLMLLLELRNTPAPALYVAGGTLIAARMLHWWGLKSSSGSSWQRMTGVGATWLVMTGLAIGLLASVA